MLQKYQLQEQIPQLLNLPEEEPPAPYLNSGQNLKDKNALKPKTPLCPHIVCATIHCVRIPDLEIVGFLFIPTRIYYPT